MGDGDMPLARASSIAELCTLGQLMVDSGAFPDTRSVPLAAVKILAGQEMGIAPFSAMAGIHVIQGRACPSAGLLAALIRRSGRWDYRVVERSDTRATVEILDRGAPAGSVTWTLDDATRAGLASKAMWRQYPRQMLFARALAEAARTYCPEVGAGPIYTPEELDDGNTVEAHVITSKAAGGGRVGGYTPPEHPPVATPSLPPAASRLASSPPAAPVATTDQLTGRVAAAMGLAPGDGPLAPTLGARPIVDGGGATVGYVEPAPVAEPVVFRASLATDPTVLPLAEPAPKARLTPAGEALTSEPAAAGAVARAVAEPVLTLADVLVRIGPARETIARGVLEAPAHEQAAEGTYRAVMQALENLHGRKATSDAFAAVGGQFRGEPRRRVPLTGLQLRALVARFMPVPEFVAMLRDLVAAASAPAPAPAPPVPTPEDREEDVEPAPEAPSGNGYLIDPGSAPAAWREDEH